MIDAADCSIANLKPQIENEWSLWSDLHRRIAVYETAPVAAEAQRREIADCQLAIED